MPLVGGLSHLVQCLHWKKLFLLVIIMQSLLRQKNLNNQVIPPLLQRWSLPPSSFVKINFDGSRFRVQQAGRSGCSSKKWFGEFLMAHWVLVDGTYGAEVTEALAALEASICTFSSAFGFSQVSVGGWSASIISTLNCTDPNLLAIGTMVGAALEADASQISEAGVQYG